MRALRVTTTALLFENVRQCAGQAIVVPDSAAGYPEDDSRPVDEYSSLDVYGLTILPRRLVAALAELFDSPARRPRIAALWGPQGAGKSTVVSELARAARIEGFVPIAAHLVERPAFAEVLAGRTLFIIDDEREAGWPALTKPMLSKSG